MINVCDIVLFVKEIFVLLCIMNVTLIVLLFMSV